MSQALSASPAVPEPAVMTTFLAIDFGLKRTGIAVGNRLLRTAQSVGTVDRWIATGRIRLGLL